MITKYAIGLDMSKKDFKVCFVEMNAEQAIQIKGSKTMPNTLKGFEELVKWVNKRQKTDCPLVYVMEATGAYHEQLAWFLYDRKYSVKVVLANRAKAFLTSLGHKSKNDKMDARGLAHMGVIQQLEEWNPLSKNIYSLRSLTRHVEALQKVRTALKSQLEQLEYGMYEIKEVKRSLNKTLKKIEDQIAICKKSIERILEKDKALASKIPCMTSIKGVSTMTVAVLIAEVNGFALIRNLKQLVSYAGYDVKENQSGGRQGKSRITKKGNAHIRRAMHMPALNLVRYKVGPFYQLYERVYQKTGMKMKGIVAVQSKLLRMLYTLWVKEEMFDENYYKETSGDQEAKALFSGSPKGLNQEIDFHESNFQKDLDFIKITTPEEVVMLDELQSEKSA